MDRRKRFPDVLVEERDEANKIGNLILKSWFTSKCEKDALHEQGHQWKQGQWTNEEVKVLQSNIEEYCKSHDIEDPTEVIFNTTKERKNFYKTIADGLERPLFSVYRRVVRMYDKKNYIGKYSPTELRQLKELQKKYGCDWTTIGHAIGRSASSVKDRCRLFKNKYRFGKWEPVEEEKLCEIVYRLSSASPGEDITCGLSWSTVSEHVGSRNEKQCRTKWLNYLNWKQRGGSSWTPSDDKLLLYRLSQSDVKEELDIDWIKMSRGWPSVRSPQWLRCKWWTMKRKANNYNHLSFREILTAVQCLFGVVESDGEAIEQEPKFYESECFLNGIQSKSEANHFGEMMMIEDIVTFDSTCLTNRFPSPEFSDVDSICNQTLPFSNFDTSTIFQSDEDFLMLGGRCGGEAIAETVVTSPRDQEAALDA